MPSKLSGFALANSYATICMSMSNRADINTMSQSLLLDTSKDILGTLEVGQAVIKLQGRIPRPFIISIPEFKIEKGKITDEQIREHMKNTAPPILEESFIIDASQPHENLELKKTNTEQMNFLKDVQENPDSGIAVRYKRLNLSVRQGQKLKAKLLKKGLIEEDKGTTHTGRLTTIKLTENGKKFLLKEIEVP